MRSLFGLMNVNKTLVIKPINILNILFISNALKQRDSLDSQ